MNSRQIDRAQTNADHLFDFSGEEEAKRKAEWPLGRVIVHRKGRVGVIDEHKDGAVMVRRHRHRLRNTRRLRVAWSDLDAHWSPVPVGGSNPRGPARDGASRGLILPRPEVAWVCKAMEGACWATRSVTGGPVRSYVGLAVQGEPTVPIEANPEHEPPDVLASEEQDQATPSLALGVIRHRIASGDQRAALASVIRELGLDPDDWLKPADPNAVTLRAHVEGAMRELRRQRIRKPVSRPRNWASDVGHGCERYLVYWRLWGHVAEPHGPDLQAVFDLGRVIEDHMRRELAAAGVLLRAAELELEDPHLRVSGRIDGVIVHQDVHYVVDFKSAARIEAASQLDLIEASQPWLRKYPATLALYVDMYKQRHMRRQVAGAWIFFEKTSGRVRVIELETEEHDEGLLYEVHERLSRVNAHVELAQLPDRVDPEEGWCQRCAFKGECNPDEPRREPMKLTTDARLAKQLARMAELEEAKREYDRIDRKVKARLKVTDSFASLIAGRTLITASTRSDGRRVFRLKHGEKAE